MSKEFHIQQLVSYISGNCSIDEQKSVELWLKLSEDNMMLHNEFKKVWESTSVINNPILINEIIIRAKKFLPQVSDVEIQENR